MCRQQLSLLGDFLPLIPSRDLNFFFFSKVNECEVISAEIIFVLFDKPGGGQGGSDCTELAHNKLKRQNSRSMLQKKKK